MIDPKIIAAANAEYHASRAKTENEPLPDPLRVMRKSAAKRVISDDDFIDDRPDHVPDEFLGSMSCHTHSAVKDEPFKEKPSRDQRRVFSAPRKDDERKPVMEMLDKALLTEEPTPPMRSLDGWPVYTKKQPPYDLHELSSSSVNEVDEDGTPMPPPPLMTIVRHNACSMALTIEDYVQWEVVTKDRDGNEIVRCVALNRDFVSFYMEYSDSALPRVNAVMTLPIVLPNGEILATNGLDRKRQTVFFIDEKLLPILPKDVPDSNAVMEAMDFLMNGWLCDVVAGYEHKCAIIALAMSCIERLLLPERPAFFIVAGRRGGGKTTVCHLVSLAVTGERATATAWADSEDERRKNLLPMFRQGVPMVCYDNIRRGAQISCPNIEKALSSPTYKDRVLGASQDETVSSATILTFTGNNIRPKGDMVSRSIVIELGVDRPDPENRPFKHPDWQEWTLNNRGAVLSALYTIMLGNPALRDGLDRQFRGRFKPWMKLIGSAVEHAASLLDATQPVDFAKMFLAGEADDEDTSALSELLQALDRRVIPECRMGAFRSRDIVDVLKVMRDEDSDASMILTYFNPKGLGLPSAKSITKMLREVSNNPIRIGNEVWTLKNEAANDEGVVFWIARHSCESGD